MTVVKKFFIIINIFCSLSHQKVRRFINWLRVANLKLEDSSKELNLQPEKTEGINQYIRTVFLLLVQSRSPFEFSTIIQSDG